MRNDSNPAAQVESAYRIGGLPAVHAQFLTEMKQSLAKSEYVSPTYLAEQAALAGRRAESLHYLEKADETRDAHLVHMKQDLAFDKLHSKPSFLAITRKMRLPEGSGN